MTTAMVHALPGAPLAMGQLAKALAADPERQSPAERQQVQAAVEKLSRGLEPEVQRVQADLAALNQQLSTVAQRYQAAKAEHEQRLTPLIQALAAVLGQRPPPAGAVPSSPQPTAEDRARHLTDLLRESHATEVKQRAQIAALEAQLAATATRAARAKGEGGRPVKTPEPLFLAILDEMRHRQERGLSAGPTEAILAVLERQLPIPPYGTDSRLRAAAMKEQEKLVAQYRDRLKPSQLRKKPQLLARAKPGWKPA